jgi:hypothetical protein
MDGDELLLSGRPERSMVRGSAGCGRAKVSVAFGLGRPALHLAVKLLDRFHHHIGQDMYM